jgi:hypothetical protein
MAANGTSQSGIADEAVTSGGRWSGQKPRHPLTGGSRNSNAPGSVRPMLRLEVETSTVPLGAPAGITPVSSVGLMTVMSVACTEPKRTTVPGAKPFPIK